MSRLLPSAEPKRGRVPPLYIPLELRNMISSYFHGVRDLVTSFKTFQGVWAGETTSFEEPKWVEYVERADIQQNVLNNSPLRGRLATIFGVDLNTEVQMMAPTALSKIAAKLPVPCALRYSQIRRRRTQLNISKRELDDAIEDEKPRLFKRLLYTLRSPADKLRAFKEIMENVAADPSYLRDTCQLCLSSIPATDPSADLDGSPRFCLIHYREHMQTLINVTELDQFQLDVSVAELAPGTLYSWLQPFELSIGFRPIQRFISHHKADIIAQMVTGDTETNWFEVALAHARGSWKPYKLLPAVHCHKVCMKATKMTIDWLQQQMDVPAHDGRSMATLAAIMPPQLAPHLVKLIGSDHSGEEEVVKLYWVLRGMFTATDMMSARTLRSTSVIRQSAIDTMAVERIAADYLKRKLTEHGRIMHLRLLHKYNIKVSRGP